MKDKFNNNTILSPPFDLNYSLNKYIIWNGDHLNLNLSLLDDSVIFYMYISSLSLHGFNLFFFQFSLYNIYLFTYLHLHKNRNICKHKGCRLQRGPLEFLFKENKEV